MRVKTPVGELSWWLVLGGNVVFWPTWTLGMGYVANRADAQRFREDDPVTRLRGWEQDGGWYRDRVAIDNWKDRLPEAGALFGGKDKRSLAGSSSTELEAFVVETRRAEHAHWTMAGGVVVCSLWNPWWAAPINVLVASISNLPCIAVQRYNRARLLRVLVRRSGRRGSRNA
jgi:glycosyl-4,4'-diaponeurosporenoate acyltransferase